MYTILMQEDIPHPRYAVLNRNNDEILCMSGLFSLLIFSYIPE